MASPTTHEHETWMADCEAVKYLTPNEFCFSGTHDSGAFDEPDLDPDVCPGETGPEIVRGLRRLIHPEKVLARWTLTQPGCPIYKQLMNGARYLDLRVAIAEHEEGEHYYLKHRWATCKLEKALNDIKRFVSAHAHRTELIVVHVQPSGSIDDKKLQLFIEVEIARFMHQNKHGNTFLKSETVESILLSGKRIIGVYDYGKRTPLPSTIWYSQKELLYDFPYGEIDNPAKKKEHLLHHLEEHKRKLTNPRKMFQLSYTLTLKLSKMALLTVVTDDILADFADRMNVTLKEFVHDKLRPEQRRLINIITVDHQNYSDVVDVCIFLNKDRLLA